MYNNILPQMLNIVKTLDITDYFITFVKRTIKSFNMFDILAHIVGYLFVAAQILAILGLLFYMIDLFRCVLSKKGIGPLPWWVIWRH